MPAAELQQFAIKFVLEVRRQDGSFVGLWKNAANDKEARQDDRVQACLLSYLSKELLIFS